MRLKFLLITLISIAGIFIPTQAKSVVPENTDTLKYVIFINDKAIGKLTAIKTINPDSSIILIVKSIASYKFLFSFKINFNYETRFSPDGTFIYSDFTYLFNDKLKENNRIVKFNESYKIYMEDKYIKSLNTVFKQSMIGLYFSEPLSNTPTISERFGEIILISPSVQHKYRIELPSGDVNNYFYENGVCSKVVIEMALADMEIRLMN